MKIVVTKDHDHRLAPARIQAFKADPEPITVKREVGEALVAAGAARVHDPETPVRPKAGATPPETKE